MNTKVIELLELLHIDLCGPSTIESIGGNKYRHVIIDDFSRFTWVHFLKKKSEPKPKLKDFIKQNEIQLQKLVQNIRSNNSLEFKNQVFEEFMTAKGVSHKFLALYIPQ